MVVKWVETGAPPHLSRKEYLRKRLAGFDCADIRNHYFGGDPREFRQQLLEWEILSLDDERKEMSNMAKAQKYELTITKEEYLQRRLAGEGRSKIIKSLGGATSKAYKLLESWGIRELDAEERELDLLVAKRDHRQEVASRTAELIGRNAEAREAAAAKQPPVEAEAQESAEQSPAEGGKCNQEQELTKQKDAEIERLNAELEDLQAALQIANHNAKVKAENAAELHRRIRGLEEERLMLVRTIEDAAQDGTDGFVTLRLPILPASVANVERARIYDAVEALSAGVEAAEIDRERVMRELFQLMQRTVSFITADLAELLPGQDVSDHVQRFFRAHNERHVESVTALQEAG